MRLRLRIVRSDSVKEPRVVAVHDEDGDSLVAVVPAGAVDPVEASERGVADADEGEDGEHG